MRPISTTLGAAGASSWLRINSKQIPFDLSFRVTLSSGAAMTYQVQHTFDDPEKRQNCSLARTTTTATLTLADHGSSVGDSVTVTGAEAPFDGTYAVATVVDANNVTYTVANSGATAAATDVARVTVFRVAAHATVTGKTASDDGSQYTAPVQAIRLNITAYTSGKATLTALQGGI